MVEVVAGLDHQSDHHAACEDLAHIEIAVGTHSAGIVHLAESLRKGFKTCYNKCN